MPQAWFGVKRRGEVCGEVSDGEGDAVERHVIECKPA